MVRSADDMLEREIIKVMKKKYAKDLTALIEKEITDVLESEGFKERIEEIVDHELISMIREAFSEEDIYDIVSDAVKRGVKEIFRG